MFSPQRTMEVDPPHTDHHSMKRTHPTEGTTISKRLRLSSHDSDSDENPPSPSPSTASATESTSASTLDASTPKSTTQSSHRPLNYACTWPSCTRRFSRPCRLQEHLRSHTGERPFACPHAGCDKRYERDYHLSRHLTNAHSARRDHKCPWAGCAWAFSTAQRLRNHVRRHEQKKDFTCSGFPPCADVFRKKSTLAAHVASVHLGQKAFPCSHVDARSGRKCAMGFDSAGKLNAHVRKMHAGPRYFCQVCDAEGGVGFATFREMKEHTRTVHPYSPKRLRVPVSELSPEPVVVGGQQRPNRKQIRKARQLAEKRQKQEQARLQSVGEESEAQLGDRMAEDQPLEPASPACLLSWCNEKFMCKEEMMIHCIFQHNMPEGEVIDAVREREALQGGVFWFGGTNAEDESAQGEELSASAGVGQHWDMALDPALSTDPPTINSNAAGDVDMQA